MCIFYVYIIFILYFYLRKLILMEVVSKKKKKNQTELNLIFMKPIPQIVDNFWNAENTCISSSLAQPRQRADFMRAHAMWAKHSCLAP